MHMLQWFFALDLSVHQIMQLSTWNAAKALKCICMFSSSNGHSILKHSLEFKLLCSINTYKTHVAAKGKSIGFCDFKWKMQVTFNVFQFGARAMYHRSKTVFSAKT